MTGENHLVERLRAGSRGREEASFAELPDGARLRYEDLFDEAARTAVVLRASAFSCRATGSPRRWRSRFPRSRSISAP